MANEIEQLKARVAELEGALGDIAANTDDKCAMRVARKALSTPPVSTPGRDHGLGAPCEHTVTPPGDHGDREAVERLGRLES